MSFATDGIVIKLSRSKTDQTGQGADCVIPYGNDLRCPVRALIDWRKASGVFDGAIFRRIDKTGAVIDKAIGPRQVNRIVSDEAFNDALVNAEHMRAHSLRHVFSTEAARLSASMPSIQRHGRWKSTI